MPLKDWIEDKQKSKSLLWNVVGIGVEFLVLGVGSLAIGGITTIPVYGAIVVGNIEPPFSPVGPIALWLTFSYIAFRFVQNKDPIP